MTEMEPKPNMVDSPRVLDSLLTIDGWYKYIRQYCVDDIIEGTHEFKDGYSMTVEFGEPVELLLNDQDDTETTDTTENIQATFFRVYWPDWEDEPNSVVLMSFTGSWPERGDQAWKQVIVTPDKVKSWKINGPDLDDAPKEIDILFEIQRAKRFEDWLGMHGEVSERGETLTAKPGDYFEATFSEPVELDRIREDQADYERLDWDVQTFRFNVLNTEAGLHGDDVFYMHYIDGNDSDFAYVPKEKVTSLRLVINPL